MIWKDKVFEDRNPMEWLDEDSGFPIGIKELVKDLGRQQVSEGFLKGALVKVRKGKDANGKIAKVVAKLVDHAELAVYLTASQALTMHLENRDHPATDMSLAMTFVISDLLVLPGIEGITTEMRKVIDGLLSTRAGQPPKVTVLVEPTKRIILPATDSEFGERVIEV
ncbi:MAG: hypothetical protein ACYTFG_17370 [Planctomycetota bacterium]|jgi:hypothetical protein